MVSGCAGDRAMEGSGVWAFVFVFIHFSREDSITVNGIHLKIGQSARSNTNLAKDFGYRGFRGEKHYLKITINRLGEILMKSAGTLFSPLNMTNTSRWIR